MKSLVGRPAKFVSRHLPRLTVEAKLFLVVSFVVTLILGVFAAVDYTREKHTLDVLHQYLMQRGPIAFESAIEQHRQHLAIIQMALTRTRSTHLIEWAVTVVVLVLALHWAVSRIVVRPTRLIMAGLNVMELGTWSPGLPVRSGDELGELTRKLNEVGKVVSYRVNVWRGAGRLSALALVSKSVGAELGPVSRAIRAAAQTLQAADASHALAYRSEVIEGLEAQAVRLEALEAVLDDRFLDTLEGVRAEQKDLGGE